MAKIPTTEEVQIIDGKPYHVTLCEGKEIGRAACDPPPATVRAEEHEELRELANRPVGKITEEDQIRLQQLTAWALLRLMR